MKRGFTLTELLIVIVIVGVLTTLAVTQYGSVKERALSREAMANLKLIAAAERIYRMEQGFFYPSGGAGQNDFNEINNKLRLSLTERNWDYNIVGGDANFTAQADRQGTGGYLDCQYKIDNNNPDEPVPTNPANCAQ
jgi:prepilin-type N-terminal cleavage/methylation domain-containing protein